MDTLTELLLGVSPSLTAGCNFLWAFGHYVDGFVGQGIVAVAGHAMGIVHIAAAVGYAMGIVHIAAVVGYGNGHVAGTGHTAVVADLAGSWLDFAGHLSIFFGFALAVSDGTPSVPPAAGSRVLQVGGVPTVACFCFWRT